MDMQRDLGNSLEGSHAQSVTENLLVLKRVLLGWTEWRMKERCKLGYIIKLALTPVLVLVLVLVLAALVWMVAIIAAIMSTLESPLHLLQDFQ